MAAEDVPPPVLAEGSLSSIATHLGRTLLIFGGAYFLRALTDFEFLPPAAGVLLGAASAILWLIMANRSGAREGQHATAVFYGIASVLLGMSILVETTTRFQLLTGAQAAVALAIFCALVLAVAARRNLQSLAWLAMLSGLPTALILLRTTHEAVPFATVLVVLGLASLWILYLKDWKALHWLGALGADSAVAIAALLSTTDQWTVGPTTAYLLGLTLLVGYSSSFAVRSHIQRRTIGAFEVVQGLFVIGIAFWTAGLASPVSEGKSTSVLGFLMLVMGVGSYALAFTPDTRSIRGRNFFFYTTVGLILIVGGSSLVLTPGKAAAAWSVLAVLMAIFSGRYSRVTPSLQFTLLLLAAGVASGIFATGFAALTSAGAEAWPTVGVWHLIVAGATVGCLFIPVSQRSERWGNLAGLPQLIVLALSVWEVGA